MNLFTRTLLASAIVLAGGAAVAGKQNDTIVYTDVDEISTFDKYYNTDRVGIILSHHIYDTLVYKNPANGRIEPSLATSWKWIDDTTLEFQLRTGVKFHDGEEFDADDVVFTLKHATDPKNKIKTTHNVAWIKDVEKVSPTTVRIKTAGPFPAALEYLAGQVPIYGNTYYAKVGPAGMNKNPIGSGPYKVKRVNAGEGVVLERNDAYFEGGARKKPAIRNVVFRSIPDFNTQVAELMTGGVDWIWKVPPDQGKALAANPRLKVVTDQTMRVGYMAMDATSRNGKSPFADKRVRQAVAHAINRRAVADGLLHGGKVVESVCFPTQTGCTDDVTRYAFDPAKARQLLAAAGFKDGFTVKMAAYRDRPIAEAIISDLKNVGIKVELNYGQYAAIRDQVRSGQASLAFMTWGSFSINDASAFTSALFTFTEDDTSRDEEIRKVLNDADRNMDPQKRKAQYAQGLKRIAEEAYVLPLWSYPVTYAHSSELQFKPDSDEIPRFYLATWK